MSKYTFFLYIVKKHSRSKHWYLEVEGVSGYSDLIKLGFNSALSRFVVKYIIPRPQRPSRIVRTCEWTQEEVRDVSERSGTIELIKYSWRDVPRTQMGILEKFEREVADPLKKLSYLSYCNTIFSYIFINHFQSFIKKIFWWHSYHSTTHLDYKSIHATIYLKVYDESP